MGSMKIILKNNEAYVVNQNKIEVNSGDMTLKEWVEMYNKTAKNKILNSEMDMNNFNSYVFSQ